MKTPADPTTRALRLLIRKHNIARIDATFTGSAVVLRAMPDGFHPAVKARREAGFAAAAKDGSITLAQASAITEGTMAEVARAVEPDLPEAMRVLRVRLEALA